jgi:FAD/FMN-containing dehydrogenase
MRQSSLRSMSYGGTHEVSTFDVHIAKRSIATTMASLHIRVDYESHIAARADHTDIASKRMERHKEALTRISRRVQWFYERKQPFRIYHGSTNSTRQPQYTRRNVVDTSPLSNIIKVDEQTKTALVEPNVPMDRLVQETIKYGLIPPVVMEFPGITVGGGFSGTSGESNSVRYSKPARDFLLPLLSI